MRPRLVRCMVGAIVHCDVWTHLPKVEDLLDALGEGQTRDESGIK
jgi:hypothetical protein